MKGQIVFINQNAGYLMIDIIHAHSSSYKSISLITGKIIPRNTQLSESVIVEKIVPYDRRSSFRRVLTWTWGFLQIVWKVRIKYKAAHLYLVSNPPLSTFIPLFCRNTFSFLIFDAYPDALVEYKVLAKDSWIVRKWVSVNKKVFAKAANIFVISDGLKNVLSKYVDASRITVSHLWTENAFLKPIPKLDNPFVKQHGLEGKFIIMYSGNLGLTHNLEILVESAKRLSDPRVVFLIIGDGEKRKSLEAKVNNENITNCRFLLWQEVDILPYSLAAADIAVVTLDRRASNLSVPSKTYNFMSVGAPLLCIADETSELSSIVNRYKCGACFSGDDAEEIVGFIHHLIVNDSALQAYKDHSLLASKDFDSSNAMNFVVV